MRFWCIADETANPRYVAADLLSQAEHDELASAILVTTSTELAKKVSEEAGRFPGQPVPDGTLYRNPWTITATSWWLRHMEDAIDAANEIASEHLEIVTANRL